MRLAEIDLAAYRHNVQRMRELTGAEQIIAVVKANGYGHGAVHIAGAAAQAGVTLLGVADIDEAVALRAAGVHTGIVAWLHDESTEFSTAIELDIELGVSSIEQLARVSANATRLERTAVIHLKAETGLNRSGARAAHWEALVADAASAQAAGAVRVRGIFSHLANASADANRAQAERFTAAVDLAHRGGLTPELVHLAASEGALTDPELAGSVIRPGIALYGLSATGEPSSTWGLTPVMTLSSTVALVNDLPAGAGVSYGYDWVAPTNTRVALVPIGYADGLPRAASGRAEVAIGGVRYPVRGRIAMDQIVVEVGDAPIRPGDRVIVWGDPATGAPTADDWANWAGTIGYELVTKVGRRVRYRWLNEA